MRGKRPLLPACGEKASRASARPDEGHGTRDTGAEVSDSRTLDARPCPSPGRPAGRLDLSPQAGRDGASPLSATLARLLATGEPAILVTVAAAHGSTPRDAGAAMLVTTGESVSTIGGGQLEFHAIDVARAMLARGEAFRAIDMPLGPLLGQCCGGRVRLELERAGPEQVQRLAAAEAEADRLAPDVLVFGCGHTGLALVRALALLPFRTTLVDDRLDMRATPPDRIGFLRLDDPVAAVGKASRGAAFVILTHSHALDYRLADAALRRRDAAYVGLIGSRTKRARFERFFIQTGGEAAELARLICPIGGGEVPDKRPEVIAALVAAELVRVFARPAPLRTIGGGGLVEPAP